MSRLHERLQRLLFSWPVRDEPPIYACAWPFPLPRPHASLSRIESYLPHAFIRVPQYHHGSPQEVIAARRGRRHRLVVDCPPVVLHVQEISCLRQGQNDVHRARVPCPASVKNEDGTASHQPRYVSCKYSRFGKITSNVPRTQRMGAVALWSSPAAKGYLRRADGVGCMPS